jgi:hypothetical protein
VLHVDLLWRPKSGSGDQLLAMADSPATTPDGGIPGTLDATWMLAAVAAQCGDQLVTRTRMTAGAQGYIEFGTNLDIP